MGLNIRVFITTIYLTLFSIPTIGADTLSLDENKTNEVVLNDQYIEIFEDSTGSMSINDVLSNTIFTKPAYFFNKNKKSAYWIKFTIRNSSGPFSNYVLENYYLHTTDIRIYYKDNEAIHFQSSGEAIPHSKRDYIHKNIVLDLPLPNDETSRTFYIRIQSKLYTDFGFRIKSTHYFTSYTINEYALLGIYYGILIIMALYNFILYMSIRYKVYLLYILYIISGIIISLNEDKLGYQYIWPEYPSLNPILAHFISPMLLIISFILYSTEFLELRKRERKLYLLIWSLFIVYTICFTINFYYPIEFLVRIVYLLPFISVFISGLIVYIKGYKYARFFIAGAALIIISMIIIQLRSENLIQGTIFTVYIFNYSLVAECIILSIALSDKIKIIHLEKEQAQTEVIKKLEENKKLSLIVNQQYKEKQILQEKVNRELETKVKERTIELDKKTNELEVKSKELEISNNKLHLLIEKANTMNIKLDIDNWELKKNVQHELLQRISGDEVSFDEFKIIFKDEINCIKFLDEIKWSKGYCCRKCSYTKNKNLDESMVRKCSRCGYPESVTTGTLLHGIKFPIQNALYLIYIIHNRNGRIKLEEIIESANISIVSASRFKNKITDKIKILEKNKKSINWEDIIF